MARDHSDVEVTLLEAALGAQYEVVRLVGRGGMGRVYLAREPFLDREVAVKVLPAEMAATGDARERFLREARTAARLSHPNIVPLHTFGQAGGLLYFVMGFVQGETLEARLRREGRVDAELARRILAELADALDYAHRAGVVHRDIKPDNVMLDAHTGRAMLTDFGIAKQREGGEALTQTGMLMGTPHYMSPEQAAGDSALDGRSDLYALGVLGYRMLSGRLPFEGARVQDVLSQHITQVAVPLQQRVPEVPLELSTAITRAMAKDPDERWATGRMLRDSLSGDNEESMPDELRMIEGSGVSMFGMAGFVSAIAYLGGIYGILDPVGCAAVVATGALAPGIGILATMPARKRYGMRTAMATWLRQPRTWSGWWPRFARRPGDVWDRLPPLIRSIRGMTTALTASQLPVFALLLYIVRPSFTLTHPHWIALLPVGAVMPGMVFVGWYSVRHRRWARANGLSRMDQARTLSESTTSRSFWSRPDIAQLLVAPPGVPMHAVLPPGAPVDVLRELDRLASMEATSAHADFFRDAAAAGHVALNEMARCDAELALLATDADPHERARIQASLDALGEPAGDDRAGKQEVRALLAKQLALFGELSQRSTEVGAKRHRLQEHLRMLGLQVAHFRAQAITEHPDAAEITGQIRALCEGIDARAEGVAGVNALLRARDSVPRM